MLTKTERLRRVVILCESFTRNYAYYRAGQDSAVHHLLRPTDEHASFWRQTNANCLDICVLEWCKLFTDQHGEHHWRQVVTDPAFESTLLNQLGLTPTDWRDHCKSMRTYRNQFVAHLDEGNVMNIPMLDVAWAAVVFYHQHVVTREGTAADFGGHAATPDALTKGYAQYEVEASSVLARF
jgi:hypothetical protein